MKTSNFKLYKKPDGIAICLFPPASWTGQIFSQLAPSKQLFFDVKAKRITTEEYETRYKNEILAKLDAATVYEHLKDNVLLCWEAPGEFCHRRIVAEWIKEKLDIEVPEWRREDDIVIDKHTPLF